MIDHDRIRADFDRIAALGGAQTDHSARYMDDLLARFVTTPRRALDLGCGTGALVAALATRATEVTGIDLSPGMIAAAKRRCEGRPNVTLELADLETWQGPNGGYDLVTSVATLHHLPIAFALTKAASLVAPGGVLLVVDLWQPRGVGGFAYRVRAKLLEEWLALIHRRRDSRELAAAWREHGAHDVYPTLGELRTAAGSCTPGAEWRVRELWRWTLAWKRLPS